MYGKKERRIWASSQDGNVSIMAAGSSLLVIGLTALAVDFGMLTLEHRTMQGLTDLSSMAATQAFQASEKSVRRTLMDNGSDTISIVADDPAHYQTLSTENGVVAVLVEHGQYQPLKDVAVTERFKAGQTPYDAIRVSTRHIGELYFGEALGIEAPEIKTQAIAFRPKTATFSIGSRLARVEGGILNALMGALLGSNISLKANDYEALLNADISVIQMLDSVATEIDLTAGTYDDLLDAEITLGQMADALSSGQLITPIEQKALSDLLAGNGLTRSLNLAEILDLKTGSSTSIGQTVPGLDFDVSLLRLFTASGIAASGEHQFAFDTKLDGLQEVSLETVLTIGERAQYLTWQSGGKAGDSLNTAQTRLSLTVRVGGRGLLKATTIKVPIYLEVARGEARLSNLICAARKPDEARAVIAARPGIAYLHVGETSTDDMADMNSPVSLKKANLLELPGVKVSARSKINIGNTVSTPLSFTYSDIERETVKRASTHTIVESAVGSLLGASEISVKASGLSLTASPVVETALVDQLSALSVPLDSVINNLLHVTGVSLGEMDVRLHDLSCDSVKLVQ